MMTQARAALRAAIEALAAATEEVRRLTAVERRAAEVVGAAAALVAKARAAVDAGVADAGAALAASLADGTVDAGSIATADDTAIADKMRADAKLAAAEAAHRRIAQDFVAADAEMARRGNAVRIAAAAVITAEADELAGDLEALEERRRHLQAEIRGAGSIKVYDGPARGSMVISARAIRLLGDDFVPHEPAAKASAAGAAKKWEQFLARLLADSNATLNENTLRLVPREAGGDAA